jgi:hypothetical protein
MRRLAIKSSTSASVLLAIICAGSSASFAEEVRGSAFAGGWDITLDHLYHYNDNPILYRQISGTQVTIIPEYERTHLVGGALSNAFGDYIFANETWKAEILLI